MFCTGMWSTVTAIFFLLAPVLGEFIEPGIVCRERSELHCTIESDLLSAKAFETNGAESKGAVPAAARVRPVSLKNRRRVTDASLFVLFMGSSSLFDCSWTRRVQIKDFASSTALFFLGRYNNAQ